MGRPFDIRVVVIDTTQWYPVIASIDCNYWSVRPPSDCHIRTVSSDPNTEDDLPAGTQEALTSCIQSVPATGMPQQHYPPRYRQGDTVVFIKSQSGVQSIVARFVLLLLFMLPVKALAQVQVNGPTAVSHVICDSGCAGGTTDTDDGSIAAGQVTSVPVALNYIYGGASWGRLTFGQATMAASLPVTIASDQSGVTVTGTVGVTQVVTPWVTNISQFGGTNVVTGTGASGAGIPRVTVSNDSTLASPSTVFSGKTTIATCGTAAAIRASQAAKGVTVKALTTNTGLIYVGPSGVASTTGIQLNAGEAVSMNIDNFATVFFDCQTNGEGVTYLGVN